MYRVHASRDKEIHCREMHLSILSIDVWGPRAGIIWLEPIFEVFGDPSPPRCWEIRGFWNFSQQSYETSEPRPRALFLEVFAGFS